LNYGNSGEIRSDYLPLNDEWYQQTVASKGKTYIYGPCAKDFLFGSSESISFCTALYDPYDREFLGVLFIDCSPEIFDLSSVNPLPEIAVLSVSNEDEILYTNQNLVPDNIHSQDTSEILEYEVPLELDGLKLHASIDREQLYREFGITRITIIYLAVTFILISVLISVILSKSLTKPITFLSEQMLAGEEAFDISATPYFNYKNEIGTLYNSYQEMLDEKNMYIKNELENKLILLDSQMKSLESQVNAHFLYNTLESINSIATVQKVPSISTMALALGSMFRYSIKTKSELVLLSDELKHVQDYTSIQEIRFDHRFSVQTNISEDLMQLRVLKLILQPLVENALYHGLNYCKTGNLITISASLDNSNLCILVRDNGVGMNVEELEHQQKLLAEKPEFTELGQRREEGIGIKNIHTRIRLYYGKHYGLKLDSQLGNGTTVQILVPVIH
jgi:two-component system sensor histidine kinase YesM